VTRLDDAPGWRRIGWWALLVAALFYARFGYSFGVGDHDEMIPQLLRLLDPSLFPADWYLQGEAGRVTVRTPFLLALRAFAAPSGVEGGVFAVWLVVLLGVTVGVWRLAWKVTENRVATALATLGAVVGTPLWALGGNGLVASLIVPEPVAWTLALPAVGLFMGGKRWLAGALLGVAGLFQLLVGTLTVGALGLVWLWEIAADEERRARWLAEVGRAVGFGVVYLLVAAPVFVPTALAQAAGSPTPDDGLSLFYVIAQLRQPHHYLFLHFGERAIAQFGLLAVLGAASFWWMRRRGGLRHERFVGRLLVVIAALCGVALVGTEGLQVLFVAKLQFYKLTVLAMVLLVTLIASAAVAPVPMGWKERADRALASPWGWAVAGVAVVAVAVLGLSGWKNGPAQHRASDLYAVEAWAREHTEPDALFLIPPSETTFRTWAHRSVAINWKPTPFRDRAMRERLARLRAVAPSAELPTLGIRWKETLDAAYHQNARATWQHLAEQWGADYALVEVDRLADPPREQPAFQSGGWAVYALAPSEAGP
jgi:hypothetical protein